MCSYTKYLCIYFALYFVTVNIHILQDFRTQITTFTNIYPPKFPESSYEITLPMPLPAGYTIVGECGEIIEVTDYDYHSRYLSDVSFSLKDTTEDLEVTALKRDGKKWAVILKTTNTFRIEEPLTLTLVAEVSILCRLFISKIHTYRNSIYRTVHIQYLYNSCINSVATSPLQRMLSKVAALGHNKDVPLQVKKIVFYDKSLCLINNRRKICVLNYVLYFQIIY